MKKNIPTDKEKIAEYEKFLHAINMARTCCSERLMLKLIENADKWSYSHRVGNGEMSEDKQDECIALNFWKLCDTDEK